MARAMEDPVARLLESAAVRNGIPDHALLAKYGYETWEEAQREARTHGGFQRAAAARRKRARMARKTR